MCHKLLLQLHWISPHSLPHSANLLTDWLTDTDSSCATCSASFFAAQIPNQNQSDCAGSVRGTEPWTAGLIKDEGSERQ